MPNNKSLLVNYESNKTCLGSILFVNMYIIIIIIMIITIIKMRKLFFLSGMEDCRL